MLETLKKNWDALNVRIIVNKREMVLGMAVCALAGFGLGVLLSPKKQVTIGSHNGNTNSGSLSSPDGSDGAEAEDEAAELED